jgi:hypothetical protein
LTVLPQPHVVIYGRHPLLLETRALILGQAGYRTSTVIELTDAEEFLANHLLDLCVLCHTLTTTLRERALATARALQPAMGVLILSADESVGSALRSTETVFDISNGPRALIAKVDTILGRQTSPLTTD